MNKFSKHIAGEDLYLEFLQALNGVLQLTNREMSVLAELIDFDIHYIEEEGIPKNVVNENNRFLIQQKLKVTRSNLSMIIKSLIDKGCLIRKKDVIEVNEALIPDLIKDKVQIILLLKLPWPENAQS